MAPDIVLVEGPPEADDILHYVGHPDLKPPVAILVYNPVDLKQASYYPFTEFSPEWIAIRYARQKRIPVRHFDLPMGVQYALPPEERDELPPEIAAREPELAALIADPLGHLARLAGYSDSERWWEASFERGPENRDVFQAVQELMGTLRHELNPPESPLTLRREAHMRQAIRTARREMFQNIAVVCGAWHGPQLDPDSFREKEDAALCKVPKKVKVAATWVPWSYERISRGSGYGAGVVSPAWYRMLFNDRESAVREWMVRTAQLLRAEDFDASSAHAIEAVRLAEALASMRGHSLPGIDELREAAVSVFCAGYDTAFSLVEKKLIVGDGYGEVPSEIPVVPLQEDFRQRCKQLRLDPSQTQDKLLELDLRESPQLEKSRFLHRLVLLGIPWGTLAENGNKGKGTFRETWTLSWKPEFSLNLIEAGMWGNTVESAATAFVLDRAGSLEFLSEVTELLKKSLLAHLPFAIGRLSDRLRDLASLTRDVVQLLEAMPPLVDVYRYGDVRGTDRESIAAILEQLVPRITIGLSAAFSGIDDGVAAERLATFLRAHRAIALLNDPAHRIQWERALQALSADPGIHPLLNGACNRLLFDAQLLGTEQTATRAGLALSPVNGAPKAAAWLDGFLHGSGLLLIHHRELWTLVDDWVGRLDDEGFQMVLPLLRRTFSKYQPVERRKMLELASGTVPSGQESRSDDLSIEGYDAERARIALGGLLKMFP